MENHNENHKNTKENQEKDHKDHEEHHEKKPQEESVVEEGVGEEEPEETKEEEEEPQEESAIEEDAGEEEPEETEEEEEKKLKVKSAKQPPSKGPTKSAIKKWINDNKFECDAKGCDEGMGGHPYRCKKSGGLNLHKYNSHGIGVKKPGKEGETEGEGEDDVAEETQKRIDKVTLRGKITKTISRISKLPKEKRSDLEVERGLMMDWKTRTYTKDMPVEELQRYESELLSSIIPAIEEFEDEIKEEKSEKKTKAEKKSKKERDDDIDLTSDMNEQMRYAMMQERLDAMEDRREERESRKRRRDQMEEEMQAARVEAMKHGGGGITPYDGSGQGGYAYAEEITFRHDENGDLIIKDGKPVPQSLKKTPIHPMMLMQPPSQGRGDGNKKDPYLDLMKETAEINREEAKENRTALKEMTKAFTDEKAKARDNEVQGQISQITKAVNTIAEKQNTDPLTDFLSMEETLKGKGLTRGGDTEAVKKWDFEIEKEKTHRSMMLKEMQMGEKLFTTALSKMTDSPVMKAVARKIDDGGSGEEEELPEDDDIEEEMKKEVEGSKGKTGKKKRAGQT